MTDYPYLGEGNTPTLSQMITYTVLLINVQRGLIPMDTFYWYRETLLANRVDTLPCMIYHMDEVNRIHFFTGEVL